MAQTTTTTTEELYAVADFCLIPIGTGPDPSVAEYIAEAQRVLEKSGLTYKMHGYGTNVEGPWNAVFKAIHDCHAAVHAKGGPRIATDIRVGTRVDKPPPTDGSAVNEHKRTRVVDILARDAKKGE